ncbi:MAG: hypothetical protein AAF471_01135 [Myxococcota bacterium]
MTASADSGLVKIGRRSIPKAKKSEHPPMPDAPCKRFEGTAEYPQGLMIGLDVRSTTVKAVVINPLDDAILWKDYRRHGNQDLCEREASALGGPGGVGACRVEDSLEAHGS